MLEFFSKLLNPMSDWYIEQAPEPTWFDELQGTAPATIAAGGGLFTLWGLLRGGSSLLSRAQNTASADTSSAAPTEIPAAKTQAQILEELINSFEQMDSAKLKKKKAALESFMGTLSYANPARKTVALQLQAIDTVLSSANHKPAI